jgi:TldD protein
MAGIGDQPLFELAGEQRALSSRCSGRDAAIAVAVQLQSWYRDAPAAQLGETVAQCSEVEHRPIRPERRRPARSQAGMQPVAFVGAQAQLWRPLPPQPVDQGEVKAGGSVGNPELEKSYVPAAYQLSRGRELAQERQRRWHRHDHRTAHAMRRSSAHCIGGQRAPVMADQHYRALRRDLIHDGEDIVAQSIEVKRTVARGRRVAAHPRGNNVIPSVDQRAGDGTEMRGMIGESVQDQRDRGRHVDLCGPKLQGREPLAIQGPGCCFGPSHDATAFQLATGRGCATACDACVAQPSRGDENSMVDGGTRRSSLLRSWPMYRSLLCGALAALVGCSGSGGAKPTAVPPLLDPIDAVVLPEIAAAIKTTASAPLTGHDPGVASPLLAIMSAEISRWTSKLSSGQDPLYYLAYQLVEQRQVVLEAEGGALTGDADDSARNLDVEVRVGSPQLDNTRPLSTDERGLNEPLTRRGVVPFGDDPQAIGNALWLETDRRYRESVQALAYVRQDQSTLSRKTNVPDFARGQPEKYYEKIATLQFDKARWIERLKRCSASALRGVATRGSCRVQFELNTSWFVNSEGSMIQQSWTSAQLAVSVGVKADDGMGLSRLEQSFGRTSDDLPSDAEIDNLIKTVTDDLKALEKAPLGDPYVGPAILEGRAAGVFFHEVFGHRIEGHRQKDDTGGQTFASMGQKIIAPTWLSVYDDPTLQTINGVQVNGFYRFDDEGVRAQRVSLIDRGKLVGFLMGRNPIEGFPVSNGHGRRSPGLSPVSRQGNLVVEATRSVERSQLEQMLIEEIKKQDRTFGMVFTDISGGFTNTSAFAPQAFKVNPVMAYRLYPDGRRELVRGVDLSGTPLVALQSIRAASREVETFNGICGAESGWVPVSASAPSLLLEKLEIEKSFIPPDRPPLLSPPPAFRAGHRPSIRGGESHR